MDNITHSLVGWALAETGLKRRSRKGLAACVLAANMPDIDVFFGWAPWAPLAMHRGFTHGLVGGVLVMPPLLAGLLWLLDRWQVRRGARFRSGLEMRPLWLLVLCYLGALTHPLLDLQNTYAVQLMSPASERWFHTYGLFIISPWLYAMLGAGIWLSRRRAKRGTGSATRPAIAALVGVIAFIGVNIAISSLAWRAARAGGYPGLAAGMQAATATQRPDRVFASPRPLAFWQREVYWRENGVIRYGSFDPLRDASRITLTETPFSDRMDETLVRAATHATPEVEDFLAWSQLPFARVERGRCEATVKFADARFSGATTISSFQAWAKMPLASPGCPRS